LPETRMVRGAPVKRCELGSIPSLAANMPR